MRRQARPGITPADCPRTALQEPVAPGVDLWRYQVSASEWHHASLGRLRRSGLCLECDAAIYADAQGVLWHAAPDGFRRL